MILTVDIGNTNISFGFFDSQGNLLKSFRIETRRSRTYDEYYAIFNSLTTGFLNPQNKITKIVYSSVVTEVNYEFTTFCKQYLNLTPINSSDHKDTIGIKVLIDNPKEVGSDRLVNSFSAFKTYKGNNIIIDFGTATTFDIVNDKCEYLGGVISPGINLSLKALQDSASKLPKISIAKAGKVIGKDTVTAMQSGIYFGYLGLIERIVESIKSDLKLDFNIIATGGLAKLFSQDAKFDHIDDNLTLRGLYLLVNQLEDN